MCVCNCFFFMSFALFTQIQNVNNRGLGSTLHAALWLEGLGVILGL